MIRIRIADLADTETDAILRPVAADWSAVTPVMRRLELAAGPEVEAQCRRIGELPPGSALITGAGQLSADYMIHVVVRSADRPVTPVVVSQGLVNGLRRAREWGVSRLAIAPLGTGAGNLDPEDVAEIMMTVLAREFGVGDPPVAVTVAVANEYERTAFVSAARRHGVAVETESAASGMDRGAVASEGPPGA